MPARRRECAGGAWGGVGGARGRGMDVDGVGGGEDGAGRADWQGPGGRCGEGFDGEDWEGGGEVA